MATYDLTTDVGKVRLLISDVDMADALFDDDEIGTFLDLEAGNVRRAAATALEAIAGNETLVLKRIRTMDLDTDGPSVAEALRELADSLRDQADETAADDEGGLLVAEHTTGVYQHWSENL